MILLSGSSSSGKTSLGQALQRRLAVPAVLVEADRVFPSVPFDHPAWESLGLHRSDVILTFHRSIAAWAAHGFNVIVDGPLPYGDRQLRDECLRVFEPFYFRIVGVRCADAVLTERESSRPDERLEGWAVRHATTVHDGMRYAAEVDTTARSPDECAEDVATQLGLSLVPVH
ncbi:MAG: phosphotransferase-like protein [Stackebrandtia sp.]